MRDTGIDHAPSDPSQYAHAGSACRPHRVGVTKQNMRRGELGHASIAEQSHFEEPHCRQAPFLSSGPMFASPSGPPGAKRRASRAQVRRARAYASWARCSAHGSPVTKRSAHLCMVSLAVLSSCFVGLLATIKSGGFTLGYCAALSVFCHLHATRQPPPASYRRHASRITRLPTLPRQSGGCARVDAPSMTIEFAAGSDSQASAQVSPIVLASDRGLSYCSIPGCCVLAQQLS